MRKIASMILAFTLLLTIPFSTFAAGATAIKFEKTSDMKAEVGKTYKREAITTPAGEAVTYSSSDKKIATVDNNTGRVTAVAEGKATITAKSGNVKASYNVVVSKSSGSTTKKAPITKLPTSQLKDGMTNEYYNCPKKHHYCTFYRLNGGYPKWNGEYDSKKRDYIYPQSGTYSACIDEFGNLYYWQIPNSPYIFPWVRQETPWNLDYYEFEDLKSLTKATFRNYGDDSDWQKIYDKYMLRMQRSVVQKMQASGFYDKDLKPLKGYKEMADEVAWYANKSLTVYCYSQATKVLNKKDSSYTKYYNDNSLTPAQRLEEFCKEWEKLWTAVDLDVLYPKYRNK